MNLATLEEMKAYLGVGSSAGGDNEDDGLIRGMMASAEERLWRATGKDWNQSDQMETAREAVFLMVWLSYWTMRGDSSNAEFVQAHLNETLTQLQYDPDTEV